MKGGSGKSTLASCLAVHWHLDDRRTAIIDADPQRTISRLAAREKALGGVHVVEDATEQAWKAARDLADTYDTVIIDSPGFRSQATLACLGVTDFVLVPVKPSPFDVDRMLDTLHILINGVSGRRPPFRCVLTQTTRDSVIAKHIRSELTGAGFPVLDNEMTNRVVYAEAALWGATPSLLDRTSPASRDIAAIADEVDRICEGLVQFRQAAGA
jgi:chromosome partitioning protein